MKLFNKILLLFLISSVAIFSQGFEIEKSGKQTFTFKENTEGSQAQFYSTTPLEDINGLTTKVSGKVSFDVEDFSTLSGKITIPVRSLKTGIRQMEKDLYSDDWIDADEHPQVTFEIKNVENINQLEPNKLSAKVTGDFTVHGVTNQETANVTVTYLKESASTQQRLPGDLLGVEGSFNIKLSHYNVGHKLLGMRVSDDIEITIKLIGSNK